MRVTKIEIKNFRAFYGTLEIDLHKAGKNLLVYGENGSGKSSLYLALKSFLESSEDAATRFENHQNIFIKDDGHIRLNLRANPRANEHVYEWSQTVKETEDPLIIDALKAKGFLDYKALLETHYIHHESDTVDVFNLLVKNLLANIVSKAANQSIGENWERILGLLPSQRNATRQIATLEGQLEVFNGELTEILAELRIRASEILRKFEDNIALDFDFQGVKYDHNNNGLDNQQILLKVKFFNGDLPVHHNFLNEAKLSAIALSIYFAQTDKFEVPVYVENKAYLQKAQEHLDANDYRGCAIYIRTAFETIIKKYCENKCLPVKYRSNPKKLDSQGFWDSIKKRNKVDGKLEQPLIHKIELCRSVILNPLSHATIVNIPRQELEDAMTAVEELQNEFKV